MKATIYTLLALVVVVLAIGMSHRPVQTAPQSPEATCDLPFTRTIRGKLVTWDQCYLHEFNHDGIVYTIRAYYTEFFDASEDDPNYPDCAKEEDDPAKRCEHALSDVDDGNGDNIYAVQLANEAEKALRFYVDRNMKPMPAGSTDFYIHIAEDPGNGWIVEPDGIISDDDKAETNDVLSVRWNVFHEMQHLIQKQYANGNWNLWYTEGLARAIEDRVDPALDAALKAFIVDSRRMLKNSADHDFPRDSDILDVRYRAVVWWNWVLEQYRDPAEVEPVQGWLALQDFYDEIATGVDSLTAAGNFLKERGSSFHADFIDYTLAMYAYPYSPFDPRLGFLDDELVNETSLENHTIISTPPPGWQPEFFFMNPRSSRYWEFEDASACDYVGFLFGASNGKPYAFSVLSVANGALNGRWTVFADSWAHTVRSVDLDRVAAVATAVDNNGIAAISYGCASPSISILNPTTAAFKMVGAAANPRSFIVQLAVTDENGAPVAGLAPGAFDVRIRKDGFAATIAADVVNALYVQDAYWLLVQAPDAAAGAETGMFYNLMVSLDDYDTDEQTNALLYVEQTQDKILVLDRSGSMADNDKLAAAQNAALLMVNELSGDDQGGYVAFDEDAYLREPLDGMDAANHREDLEDAIVAETPGTSTSIGDGMARAAQEHDAKGLDDNACTFVLLSDGYENEQSYWTGVEDEVVDNGCALNAIAFGPQANEDLLQQIAGAGPASTSGYDYAPDSGNITFDAPGGTATVGWENYLSRLYDYRAARAAGRQRIFSDSGPGTTAGVAYSIVVDETTDELVVATAWQTPSPDVVVQLYDLGGAPLSGSFQRRSANLTNDVWRVPDPEPGTWMLEVRGATGEHYVSASARTALELHLFAGQNTSLRGDIDRPLIVGSLYNNGEAATGATVTARVTAPNGVQRVLALHDDGAHGDMLANDGVYGNYYSATALGEEVPADPNAYDDGDEPVSVGSYLVEAVALWNGHRREAQSSFALQQDEDRDGDTLPNRYEVHHGFDPDDPGDAGEDSDLDGLTNRCEFELGTEPRNSDTDGGGESDGSEAPRCRVLDQDPLDPADDRVGAFRALQATPGATSAGAHIEIKLKGFDHWDFAAAGPIEVALYRREGPAGFEGFRILDITDPTVEVTVVDDTVLHGKSYQYLILPYVEQPVGAVLFGRTTESRVVVAKNDPYGPEGSIIVNDGALTTASRLVTLSIIADDRLPDHGELDEEPRPGDGTDDLAMRLSNSPDFDGVSWQPYQSTVENWNLGDVQPGEEVAVYVQFRDTSGNVGASGLGQVDSIVYKLGVIHLPMVAK